MAVRRGPCGTDGAGIRFLELKCKDAAKVGRFYEEIFGSSVFYAEDGQRCAVCAGPSSVHLVFTTCAAEVLAAEAARASGVHICIYISNFQTVYDRLAARGLIWTNPRFVALDTCDTYAEAAASRQFRFRSIIDLESGEELLELEHETRTCRHVQYMKHIDWAPRPATISENARQALDLLRRQ